MKLLIKTSFYWLFIGTHCFALNELTQRINQLALKPKPKCLIVIPEVFSVTYVLEAKEFRRYLESRGFEVQTLAISRISQLRTFLQGLAPESLSMINFQAHGASLYLNFGSTEISELFSIHTQLPELARVLTPDGLALFNSCFAAEGSRNMVAATAAQLPPTALVVGVAERVEFILPTAEGVHFYGPNRRVINEVAIAGTFRVPEPPTSTAANIPSPAGDDAEPEGQLDPSRAGPYFDAETIRIARNVLFMAIFAIILQPVRMGS